MTNADGQVWIKTEIDNSDAEKELRDLERDIQKFTRDVGKKEAVKIPLEKQLEEYGVALDNAKAKMQELLNANADAAQIRTQQAEVNELQKKWDAAADKVDKYNREIQYGKDQIAYAQARAGQLTAKMTGVGAATAKMAEATEKAQKKMQKLRNRIGNILKSALVFSVLYAGLNKLKNLISSYIKKDKELSSALAGLKGAWLTAFQPIWEIIKPALLSLIRILTAVANAISRVFSVFTGKSTKEMADNAKALNTEQEALEGVGGAAEDASKSLAGFDEINQLDTQKPGGGGGGASEETGIDFGAGQDQVLSLKEKLLALGAAAAGAGIMFGSLGAGITLVVGGAALLIYGIKDIVKNGLTLENMLQTVAGLLSAGIGIGLITGSWIPLLVAGITSIVLALAYMTGNGEELIGGLKDIFNGLKEFVLGVFTGDWKRAMEGINQITAGIGRVWDAILDSIEDAFIMFLDWLDEKTGGKFSFILDDMKMLVHFAFKEIKDIFRGLLDFIVGVFTGDWERAWQGVVKIFNTIFGPVIDLIQRAIDKMRELREYEAIGKQYAANYYQENYGGQTYAAVRNVPALASGAVIPPNQKFLALLGDQKSGTNIETPLSTMVQAFRQAMNEGGYGGKRTVILQVDKREFGRVTFDAYNEESQRVGVSIGGEE